MKLRTRIAVAIAALGVSLVTLPAAAQDYPAKPVRVIVPQPPGGTDTVARLVVQKLSESMGQPFIVENRPGAGGTIGAAFVAKAPADGYTLLINASVQIINSFIFKDLPFDALKDFTHITQIASTALVVVVHPSITAKNIRDLARGGSAPPLNWAIAGIGAADHLAAETLKSGLGIALQTVPYKGVGPALADVIGGQVAGMMPPVLPALAHIRSGKVRALAVSSLTRNAGLPGVPTVAESGLPGFELLSWYGLWGPKGMPRHIAARLQAETAMAIRSPDVRQKLPVEGFELNGSTPDEFSRYVEAEGTRYSKIVREGKITGE